MLRGVPQPSRAQSESPGLNLSFQSSDAAWQGWNLTLLTLPGRPVSGRVGFCFCLAGLEFDPAVILTLPWTLPSDSRQSINVSRQSIDIFLGLRQSVGLPEPERDKSYKKVRRTEAD